MDATFLTQLQQSLTALACAAVTAGVGYGVTWLSAKLHITKSDSAEAAVRTAAQTEAGKLAATIPAASAAAVVASPTTSVASLFPTAALQAAAGKVIADLPAEIKLTGYNPTDIVDMILGNLPALLGAVNPALGTAAAVIKDVVVSAGAANKL
jgi:hypothetical protein